MGASQAVGAQNWVSEAVLWTHDWVHCGMLRAATDCRLLALDAQKFQESCGSFASTHAHQYAVAFVKELNEEDADFQTDINEYSPSLGDLLSEIFPEQFLSVRFEYESRTSRRKTKENSITTPSPSGIVVPTAPTATSRSQASQVWRI